MWLGYIELSTLVRRLLTVCHDTLHLVLHYLTSTISVIVNYIIGCQLAITLAIRQLINICHVPLTSSSYIIFIQSPHFFRVGGLNNSTGVRFHASYKFRHGASHVSYLSSSPFYGEPNLCNLYNFYKRSCNLCHSSPFAS